MRKSWVVTGSDDMQVRIFNYNTLEKVHTFEAHTDYIRSIIVHPTHPYVLTSSGEFWPAHACTSGSHACWWLTCVGCADDMLIKLWDWEKKWQCSQVFEGHSHYVMMIVLNPKDNNQFASASLDRTIRVSGKGRVPWFEGVWNTSWCVGVAAWSEQPQLHIGGT